jgi:hypothetical protein
LNGVGGRERGKCYLLLRWDRKEEEEDHDDVLYVRGRVYHDSCISQRLKKKEKKKEDKVVSVHVLLWK